MINQMLGSGKRKLQILINVLISLTWQPNEWAKLQMASEHAIKRYLKRTEKPLKVVGTKQAIQKPFIVAVKTRQFARSQVDINNNNKQARKQTGHNLTSKHISTS